MNDHLSALTQAWCAELVLCCRNPGVCGGGAWGTGASGGVRTRGPGFVLCFAVRGVVREAVRKQEGRGLPFVLRCTEWCTRLCVGPAEPRSLGCAPHIYPVFQPWLHRATRTGDPSARPSTKHRRMPVRVALRPRSPVATFKL